MPISGLVLSLAPDADVAGLAAELRDDSRVDVGSPTGRRMPIVTETSGRSDDRALWSWIESRPGVVHVDVAFIQFDPIASVPDDARTGDREQEVDVP